MATAPRTSSWAATTTASSPSSADSTPAMATCSSATEKAVSPGSTPNIPVCPSPARSATSVSSPAIIRYKSSLPATTTTRPYTSSPRQKNDPFETAHPSPLTPLRRRHRLPPHYPRKPQCGLPGARQHPHRPRLRQQAHTHRTVQRLRLHVFL